MSLKLNSSGGGSVTLQEPTTASDVTLSLPAATGTVVYENASGNVGIGTSSPSSPLQVHRDSVTFVNVKISNSVTGSGALDGFDLVCGTAGEAYVYNRENQPLIFGTNNIERARIDSSGNLLLGTTSNIGSGYKVSIQPSASGGGGVAFRNVGVDGVPHVFFNSSNSVVGSIQTTNTATSFVTSSDYRLKENVQPMTGALDKVSALKPCTYTWKESGEDSQGFIAHELAEVVPECVTGEKDAVNEDGSIKPQGIDTSFLVATIVAAIQEQQQMIETLQAKVAALEAQ